MADRAAKLGSTQNNYPGAGGCCCSTRTEYSLLDSLGRGHRTAAQWCYNNAAITLCNQKMYIKLIKMWLVHFQSKVKIISSFLHFANIFLDHVRILKGAKL